MSTHATEEPIRLPTDAVHPFGPPPQMAELQAETPLRRLAYVNGTVGWLVTSHALARSILTDDRFAMHTSQAMPLAGAERASEIRRALEQEGVFSADPVSTNPPQHTRLRRLTTPQYTTARVGDYRAHTERAVADALDALEAAGPPADLVGAFAFPVVSATHAEVFGISRADCDRLVEQSSAMLDPSVPLDEVLAELRELKTWFSSVLDEKRARPDDDLMSVIAASDDLTIDEKVSLSVILAISGHDTTASMIAGSAFALLCNEEQMDAVRADPSLIDGAVDEFLRYFTLLKTSFTRIAREDVEVGGHVISAGECVSISIPAANRDPAKFDDPDRLDVRRNARGHLAFGHGIHVCLGQHLARLEMRVALTGLIERFPTLRLAVPVDRVPMESDEHPFHVVKQLEVAW